MVDVNANVFIITLNVYGLNVPVKRQIVRLTVQPKTNPANKALLLLDRGYTMIQEMTGGDYEIIYPHLFLWKPPPSGEGHWISHCKCSGGHIESWPVSCVWVMQGQLPTSLRDLYGSGGVLFTSLVTCVVFGIQQYWAYVSLSTWYLSCVYI